MKRLAYFLAVTVIGASITGCVSPYGRPDYTASGALAGGATGALIGSTARHPGTGALIGAAAGTIVGGMIGHGMDQAQEAQLRAQAPQTLQRVDEGQPLTVSDVEALTKAGIGDDLIISQIRNSRTVYYLTTSDIIALKNAGVSERVIDYMINTRTETPSAQVEGVYGPVPPQPMPQTVVVAPAPDYVWVNGVWLWGGSRWVWRPGYWHRPRHPRHHRHGW